MISRCGFSLIEFETHIDLTLVKTYVNFTSKDQSLLAYREEVALPIYGGAPPTIGTRTQCDREFLQAKG